MRTTPCWLPPDLALLDERCPLPVDAPFTTQQALELGVSRWYLRLLLDRALMRPVLRGTYVAVQVRDTVDLGRLLWRFDALAALDGFLRLGVPHDHLLLSVERFAGQRGVVQLRALAPLADGRAESAGESAMRLHWHDAGLPTPEPQWWVFDDHGVAVFRLDLALPDLRFAAEYDGRRFHEEKEGQPEHDEDRREWLDTQRRWHIEVFVQDDVYAPGADPGPRLREGVRTARTRSGLWVPESAYRRQA